LQSGAGPPHHANPVIDLFALRGFQVGKLTVNVHTRISEAPVGAVIDLIDVTNRAYNP
jgi:hypothetical protein